jgi:S-adenosylmethionine decarboxylase proenzyme
MGQHFLVDLFEVDRLLLEDMQSFIDFIRPLLRECMAEVLSDCYHKFPGEGGYTYLALLSTSHFSAHSWPEKNSIAIDMFSCGSIQSDYLVSEVLRYFNPQSYNIKKVVR